MTIAVADALPKIFDQVQTTVANHQKNAVALYKIHIDAAAITEPIHRGRSIKLTGERQFEDTFISLLCRVLVVKKGVVQADRVFKFVAAYVRYLNSIVQEKNDQDDDDDDNTISRFMARLLKFLLKGFVAKDKVVRYRCVHMLAQMVARMGEVDEDVYQVLRTALIERAHDREAIIRVQAAVGLSKLCGSEDPSDIEEGEQTAIDVLSDMLNYDPASDVRRAALLNMPITQLTIPAILARSRDTDTVVRRLIYAAVLEKNCTTSDGSAMGPLHPRVLSIAQRELIIRNGLGDREPAVRAAAGSLLGVWVDVVRGIEKPEEGTSVIDDLLALLALFDLHENTVAEDALLSIFATRVDIFDQLEFKDTFWDSLTPEKAYLARVYVEHCIATNDQAKLDASIPVVTNLAFRIQNVYNEYQQDLDAVLQERALANREAYEQSDDILLDAEFVIAEMLKLAGNLDYADEIGRRKMFQLVRDMIGQDALPEGLMARCLDVLRVLSPSERDLIRVVVEVVHELRDEAQEGDDDRDEGGEDDASPSAVTVRAPKAPKPPKELGPEEQARADALDIRCLSLCIGMLERVNGTFEENSTLEGILGELIVPSVKRKELVLREKGLVCLGLCCLIARRMALNSYQLFLSQVQSAPEILKTRVLQIVFDILMVHEADFLGKGGATSERIVEILLHILNDEDSDKVQALLCIGLAKLVLAGMLSDERVLKSLVVAYLSPDTAENQELRQCLAYFFPIYCYSSSANQTRMRQITVQMFEQLAAATRDLDDDQEMASTAQIIGMFVDWTDPQKVLEVQGQTIDDSVHLDLAEDILRALFKDGVEKDDTKVLCQVLGRLHLPGTVDDNKIRTVKLLVQNLFTRRPIQDVSARSALSKFETTINKKYADKLTFTEEEYRQLEELEALFKFLDDIVPLDDAEDMDMSLRTRGRKRRSESVVTETTSSAAEDTSVGSGTSEAKKGKGKGKGRARQSKRRRVSRSDESEDELPEGHVEATPKRTLPRRAVSVKKVVPTQDLDLGEDVEEEDEEEDEEATPAPRARRGRTGSAPASRSGNTSFDSIIDSEEEEEEEVLSIVVHGDS